MPNDPMPSVCRISYATSGETCVDRNEPAEGDEKSDAAIFVNDNSEIYYKFQVNYTIF